MPASRSPARSANSILYQGSPTGLNGSDAQCGSSPPSHAAPQPASPSVKRRRTPNAFILYRSNIFAEKKFPPELTHQNDISRYAAMLWERLSEAERSVFFKMAEDMKLRAELESPSSTLHKKRRSKSGKTNSSRTGSLCTQLSTAGNSASDTGSPMLPMLDNFTTLSGSPLSVPAPNTDPFTPKELNSTLTSPKAPQAIHAIPPHLLNWGRDLPADGTKSVAVESNEHEPARVSSHSSLIPYEIDANCFDSLDAEMIEMYSYFLSAMSDTQTFGYHFPV